MLEKGLIKWRLACVAPIELTTITSRQLPRFLETSVVNDLFVGTGLNERIKHVGWSKGKNLIDTAKAVDHDVPAVIEIYDLSLTMRVQDVLIVVDESVVGGELKPFLHRVTRAHGPRVQDEDSGLEIAIGVFHAKDLLGIGEAIATLHINVGDKIDIVRGGQQRIAQIGSEELGDIPPDDQVGIEIQNLVVIRQQILNQEAIIRLDADVRVIRREVIFLDNLRDITEAKVDVVVT